MSSESEMTKPTPSNYTPLGLFYQHPRLIQGLSLMGSLSLLSTGLVVAQTDSPIDAVGGSTAQPVVPTKPALAPRPVVAVPPPAPHAAPKPEPAPVVSTPAPRSAASVVPPTPAPEASAPASAPPTVVPKKPRLAAPTLAPPPPATLARPPRRAVNPGQAENAAQRPLTPNNQYIDPTNYNVGVTGRYQSPAAVVLTERSTGCQTVSQNGRLTRGVCGGIATNAQTTPSRRSLNRSDISGVTRLPGPPVRTTPSASFTPVTVNSATRNVTATRRNPVFTGRATVPINSPAPTGATTPTGLAYYNLTTRPAGRPMISSNSFIFPLTIPASISSLFGWRVHPISGERRFHSGTDLAAPQGTPVIAAASGEVVTADFSGGYGLMVILRHDQGQQESRYAHLSEVFVQPGEWVDQGTVIGRVGTTGYSTGPHLHFEWRNLTSDGWVAVDAGNYLQYALAQLMEALKVAQTTPQPRS